MLSRKLDNFIERHYANNKSVLLLKGARQVGENTGFIIKIRQLNHSAGGTLIILVLIPDAWQNCQASSFSKSFRRFS